MTQTLTTEQLKNLTYSGGIVGDLARELLANREAQPVSAGKFAGYGLYHAERDEFGSWLKAEPQSDCSDAITKHGYVNVKLFTAPPAPANAQAVAWEMRYWNSGHNCWHDWERITAEQHAEMSVKFATNNDYEFRVLYDAPPAPAVPEEISTRQAIVKMDSHEPCDSINVAYKLGWNACRAAMLAQPVSQRYTLPPHVFRELVNSLRDTAVKYQGTQQLREQLSRTLTDKGLSAAAQEGGNDHDAGR
ncbi:hypothetical protein I5T96_04485 [Serratia marcescens]|nr:hypothetical protein [Serratia marcescens]